MSRKEKISFLVPFNSDGELKLPQVEYKVGAFPEKIDMKLSIGFVELIPDMHYRLSINIFPNNVSIGVGEQIDIEPYTSDVVSMRLNTKKTDSTAPISATITVDINGLNIVAKGTYIVTANLIDGTEEINRHTAYFSVSLKDDIRK